MNEARDLIKRAGIADTSRTTGAQKCYEVLKKIYDRNERAKAQFYERQVEMMRAVMEGRMQWPTSAP